MTTNSRFGTLSGNKITYAPTSFTVDGGVIINPPDEMYLARGWYRVIDDRPGADPGCYVKFDGYDVDDEAKTITFVYTQQMIPVIRPTYTYSKLKLEMALFKIGKLTSFNQFLYQTFVENEFGDKMSIRGFYDQANDLRSDNEQFEHYYAQGRDFLGLDEQTAQAILSACIMDN